MTPALLARLRAHKGAILRLLAGGDIDAGPADGRPDLQADGAVGGAPQDAHARGDIDAGPAGGLDGRPSERPAMAHGDAHGADPTAAGPRDPDPDAAGWTEYATPDGRHGWRRSDLARCVVVDLQTCPTCNGIDFWQDLAGGWHCAACSPRTAGPRLRALAEILRQNRRSGLLDASAARR